jgi:hypothetical protein
VKHREPGSGTGAMGSRKSIAIESLETRMCLSASGPFQHEYDAARPMHAEQYHTESFSANSLSTGVSAEQCAQAAPSNFSTMSVEKIETPNTQVTIVSMQSSVYGSGAPMISGGASAGPTSSNFLADGSLGKVGYHQDVRADYDARFGAVDGDRQSGFGGHWKHGGPVFVTSIPGIVAPPIFVFDPSFTPPTIGNPAPGGSADSGSGNSGSTAAPINQTVLSPGPVKPQVARNTIEPQREVATTAAQRLAATNVRFTPVRETSSRVAEILQNADHAASSFVASSVSRFASLSGERLSTIWSIVTNASLGGGGGMEKAIVAGAEAAVAGAAEKVEGLLAQTAASVANTPVRAYEFAHLGSPITLLADSLASFVEDSASMPVAAAQVRSQGPWMLTFGVLAADVVVLTYMHRKSVKRRMRSSSSLLQPAM